jgi:Holliday junction resolvasome RuvABC ATP-dependent DNA helicase subunit
MDSKIYFIPKHKTISITSNYSEIKKWMDSGINPKVEYIPIVISELNQYEINNVGFDKIDNNYFQTVKESFSKLS